MYLQDGADYTSLHPTYFLIFCKVLQILSTALR